MGIGETDENSENKNQGNGRNFDIRANLIVVILTNRWKSPAYVNTISRKKGEIENIKPKAVVIHSGCKLQGNHRISEKL